MGERDPAREPRLVRSEVSEPLSQSVENLVTFQAIGDSYSRTIVLHASGSDQ